MHTAGVLLGCQDRCPNIFREEDQLEVQSSTHIALHAVSSILITSLIDSHSVWHALHSGVLL